MKDDTMYFPVYHWMVSRLGLRGVQLLMFACLYNLSKDNTERIYTGSRRYLRSRIGSKDENLHALIGLINKGYVIRLPGKDNRSFFYRINTDYVDYLRKGGDSA